MKIQMAQVLRSISRTLWVWLLPFESGAKNLPKNVLRIRRLSHRELRECVSKGKFHYVTRSVACFVSCPWGMQCICKATKGRKVIFEECKSDARKRTESGLQAPLDEMEVAVTSLQFIAIDWDPKPQRKRQSAC